MPEQDQALYAICLVIEDQITVHDLQAAMTSQAAIDWQVLQAAEQVTELACIDKSTPTILLDLRQSAENCDLYERALAAGIHVIGNSLECVPDLPRFLLLAAQNEVRFMFGASFWDGLPILATLAEARRQGTLSELTAFLHGDLANGQMISAIQLLALSAFGGFLPERRLGEALSFKGQSARVEIKNVDQTFHLTVQPDSGVPETHPSLIAKGTNGQVYEVSATTGRDALSQLYAKDLEDILSALDSAH